MHGEELEALFFLALTKLFYLLRSKIYLRPCPLPHAGNWVVQKLLCERNASLHPV